MSKRIFCGAVVVEGRVVVMEDRVVVTFVTNDLVANSLVVDFGVFCEVDVLESRFVSTANFFVDACEVVVVKDVVLDDGVADCRFGPNGSKREKNCSVIVSFVIAVVRVVVVGSLVVVGIV